MKIPRWLMAGLSALIVLVVICTAVVWWRSQPGPNLGGSWSGPGWGAVELERTADGSYQGTYSSTYGQSTGRIQIEWSPRIRQFEGTWSEGTYRFGRVSLWTERDGTVRGFYSADPNCAREPGDPVRQEFQWLKGRAGRLVVVGGR